jgi:hypothetical protein
MASYNRPAPKRIAKTEHNETVFQSNAVEKGDLQVHPAIAEGLHTFANNPKAFTSALKTSRIEELNKGMNIGNTDFGSGTDNINKEKQNRVSGLLKGRVDRPVVMRYTDRAGKQFNHLVSGNTRATNIGEGVQAHIINLGGSNGGK